MFTKIVAGFAGVLLLASPLAAEEKGLFSTFSLTPDVAVKAAQAALKSCRDGGYQVAVAVVDRGGNMQVMIRDRFAGPHTPDTAYRKAWTAVSFRTATGDMATSIKEGTVSVGVRNVTNALMLGGGVMFETQGSVIGAIGISGAPGGESEAASIDRACAEAGIEAISDVLDGF